MRTPEPDGRGPGDRTSRLRATAAAFSLLLAVLALPSYAQSGPPRRIGGLSLGGLFPAGGFNDHVRQNGLGCGGYYGWRVRTSPVFWGLELTIDAYGHAVRTATVYGLEADVETYNYVMQALGFLRIQPRTGAVVTYLEALAGASYLFTETSFVDDYDWEDASDSDTNFEDYTWTAGLGAGLSVRLGRRAARPGRGIYLDLKVRFMAGGQAQYLKQGSAYPGEFDDSVVPDRSATSFITARVGLSWFF